MKKHKKIIIILELLITTCLISGCYDTYPIEELGVLLGVGYDIEFGDKVIYVDPAEIPIIGEGIIASNTYIGKGHTVFELVENRMTKMPSRFSLGTELVSIISEERARFGIEDLIDSILRDPNAGLKSLIAVNKGRCVDYYTVHNKSEETNSDILYNVIRLAHLSNFFTKDVSVDNIIRIYYQEGRKICLPYIELISEKPQITGLALFSHNKMAHKVPIKEAKLLNLLRNYDGKGYLYLSADEDQEFFDIEEFENYKNIISNNPLKYIDFNGNSSRKVKVSMEEGRLKYDIIVDISGVMLINTLVEQKLDKNTVGLIEKAFTKKMEKQLSEEVSKVQKVYKEDFLDITQYAVAKYGRQSVYSSDEYFENSIINVKVNFKIESVGRNSEN
ncbi:spore germination protein [Vallitalea longa]|uniref:Spore germination protein n=1 Tax=Vallitalea longa TaxID=2936439 RepID=A0A9W6DDC0_9FIRM|nr:Ger(x)C family spore germination C-terminal domain-containing protein [Vallitalea longa]GKX28561.1 spore germination protein [Vallitalea longa]